MSQHDMTIDNGAGLPVRNDINAALQALASQSSGASAPSPTFPCQVWADTASGRLKRRNAANSGWLDEGPLDAPLRDAASQGEYVADTGTANAYVCNFVPAITTRSESTPLRFKVTNANNGACTINDGIGVVALVGSNNSPLQGGELVANGIAWVQWNSSVGGGSYVLLFCTGATPRTGHGQCRLSVVSTSSLKLAPYGGQSLIINGALQLVPSAGITIGNGSLVASTRYFVYVFMSSGVMTLELSTAGHTTHTNGVEIKSGDPTRTFVGMIYTNASIQFLDAPTTRHCLNWFNRLNISATITTSGSLSFTNGGSAKISPTVDLSFLCWGDEAVYAGLDGSYNNVTTTTSTSVREAIDGVAFGAVAGAYANSNGGMNYSSSNIDLLSEGIHIASVFAGVSGGTGTVTTMSHKVLFRG